MRRRYSIEDFQRIINEFRSVHPFLNLSTDIICGFPGETEEQFKDSVNLVKTAKPDILNISRFWPRPGTEASRMKNQIHGRITKNRSRMISKVSKKISLENNQNWIGWEGEILIDEEGKDRTLVGRNSAYKPIVIREKTDRSGFVPVKVTGASPTYLIGRINSFTKPP
jgi:tRNA A37 methylthiotransferase MiaB